MEETVSTVLGFWWVIPILAALVGYKLVLRLFGVVMIPDDSIGIVTKKFVLFGSNRTLPDGAIVALKGEAGVQADPLAPGLHFLYWPWQYSIEQQKFVTIGQNMVGVVEARDGKSPDAGRVLGRGVDCDSFQDARKFLEGGGQRGPQIAVIPPGTYRINTGLFSVKGHSALEIDDTQVGVVTTKDGAPLRTGDIAGREIADHRSYQDGDAFIKGGGFRGLQEQVLLAGRYYLNPMFATVEPAPMTIVPIATAGVMISFVGDSGVDVTGDTFQHGNLVQRGHKGVWAEPLDPGKYPINPFTHKLECVSTANIVLNWANAKTEAHNLDENLKTINLRSSDGFVMTMDVSVIIHIPRNDAPKVIARFGTLQNLVTQVLEPLISNHFRNAAQQADAIDFLTNRTKRQQEAKAAIAEALAQYNVIGVDTLIGDINPPKELMKTLTDRKIAEQEKITFGTQQQAATERQKYEQANALADTQKQVVAAERQVAVAEYTAQASVMKAKGDAEAKQLNATADAKVLELVGNAEATKVRAVGDAEAEVIQKKTAAIGAENFALIETARAISESGQALVPEILVAGGKEGKGGSIMDALVARMMTGGAGAFGGGSAHAGNALPKPMAAEDGSTAVVAALAAQTAASNGKSAPGTKPNA